MTTKYNITINKRVFLLLMLCICLSPIAIEITQGEYTSGYLEQTMIELNNPTEDGYVLDLMQDGDVYEQSFFCTYRHIKSIGIYVITYGRKNSGTLTAQLIDNTDGTEIYRWNINMENIENMDYLLLSIDNPEIFDTEERNFTVRLFTNGTTEYRNISLKKTNEEYTRGDLYINGKKTENDIVFNVSGYASEYSLTRTRLWVCLYIFFVLVFIYNMIEEKGKKIFD